jgi:hypothetical protein
MLGLVHGGLDEDFVLYMGRGVDKSLVLYIGGVNRYLNLYMEMWKPLNPYIGTWANTRSSIW